MVARYPSTAGYPLLYLVAQATSAEGTHTYAEATRAHAIVLPPFQGRMYLNK
jgi:hypothetical protein